MKIKIFKGVEKLDVEFVGRIVNLGISYQRLEFYLYPEIDPCLMENQDGEVLFFNPGSKND